MMGAVASASPAAKRSGALGMSAPRVIPSISAKNASAVWLASVQARSGASAQRMEMPDHTASPSRPTMAMSEGPDRTAAWLRARMSAHAAVGAAMTVANSAAVAPRVARPSPRSMPPFITVSRVQPASSRAPTNSGVSVRARRGVSGCPRDARTRQPHGALVRSPDSRRRIAPWAFSPL